MLVGKLRQQGPTRNGMNVDSIDYFSWHASWMDTDTQRITP